MATRRRTTARKTPAPRPSRARQKSALSKRLTPDVVRSIVGLTLLVLGAMTLIALTGWGKSEDRDRALSSGFDHHLTKPIDLEAVHELLGRLAGSP